MTDKQAFAAIVGGILSSILGGFILIIPIQLIYEATGRHIDGGDDGWGFLWIALSILSGIVWRRIFCAPQSANRVPHSPVLRVRVLNWALPPPRIRAFPSHQTAKFPPTPSNRSTFRSVLNDSFQLPLRLLVFRVRVLTFPRQAYPNSSGHSRAA